MSEDKKVSIEVDGQALEANPGQMLIEVTDANGIYIPRFCYHEKLSIAANCRMCLVEMEKGRKPMPACATPVGDGMKFFTRSAEAIAAQRATMEFLLINHPLDCPICDQGGECELQDLAMGYGRGISRYAETKRSVQDKELGPLVSTDMTRCIHCTRCVRFGEEVAGIQELGTIGRGEHVEIAPYIAKTVDHELSGNIIDLCPVGALNSKPFRFRARSWEMEQAEVVSPHDSFGSNMYAHILRGRIMRVVPKQNEDINETWLSDRDRFSYEGLYTEDRVTAPMVKRGDQWETTDWATALNVAAKGIKEAIADNADNLGVIAAPWSTSEELHLIERLTRSLGSANLDSRLRAVDTSAQNEDAAFPGMAISLAEVEQQNSIALIGCRVRQEVPMLAHRVRKAHRNNAQVSIVNETADRYLFPLHTAIHAANLLSDVAALARAADASASGGLQNLISDAQVNDAHRQIVASLKAGENAAVILGHAAQRHANFGAIRALASAVAKATGATLNIVSEAANSAGAAQLGVLPHREAGGRNSQVHGKGVQEMLAADLPAYMLFGVEAEHDIAHSSKALAALANAAHVVCASSYLTDAMREYANVILPLAAFGESAGTFVNTAGAWQSFQGVAQPQGDARPGWKVLRVLANELELDGFEYVSPVEVLTAAQQAAGNVSLTNEFAGQQAVTTAAAESDRTGDLGLYVSDPIVRRAQPLQDIGQLDNSTHASNSTTTLTATV